MSYSKIILDPTNKNWPIITEDISLVKLRPPLYTLYRFNVYKLKILEKDWYDDETLLGFVIQGGGANERAIVFLTVESPKKIVRYRVQKKVAFCGEQALLISYALMVRLHKEGYELYPFAFPKQK